MSTNTFDALAKEMPALIARAHLPRYGWPFAVGYMANLDSEGRGPEGRLLVGRKVVYPRAQLIQWLREQSTSVEARG